MQRAQDRDYWLGFLGGTLEPLTLEHCLRVGGCPSFLHRLMRLLSWSLQVCLYARFMVLLLSIGRLFQVSLVCQGGRGGLSWQPAEGAVTLIKIGISSWVAATRKLGLRH